MAIDDEDLRRLIQQVLLGDGRYAGTHGQPPSSNILDNFSLGTIDADRIKALGQQIDSVLNTHFGDVIETQDVRVDGRDSRLEVAIEYVVRRSGKREVVFLEFHGTSGWPDECPPRGRRE